MVSEERAVPSDIASVLDRMSDAFLSVDDNWIVTFCNDRAENVLGRPSDELVGRSLWSEFPTAVDTPLYDRCVAAMDERTRETFEIEFEPIDARLSVRVYPRDDGLSLYLRDVSLRHRREEELTRYTTVVEAVSDGVVVVGDAGTITMVNEAVEDLFDANRGRLIGADLAELSSVTKLTPDDVDRISTAVDAVAADGAEERTLQLEVPGDSGDRRVTELRLVRLPGSPEGSVVGVIRDVTERVEHERVVTSLHEATRHLFEADNVQDICATAVHTGADLLDLQISGIFLLDEERNRLEPIAATAGAHDMFGGLPTFAENEGIVWDVFRRGEGTYFEDVSRKSGIYNPETTVQSELIVPIGEQGVLMAGETRPGVFDDTDLELAEILASHTDVALDRARRERLLQNRADTLERQRDRMDAVTQLLSGPIDDALADIETDHDDDRIAAARQFVEDACHVAGSCHESSARERLALSDLVDTALTAVDADPSVASVDGGSVRARPDAAERLFVALVRIATRKPDATITVAVDDDGFAVEDDLPPLPPSDRTPPFDLDGPDRRTSIELAVARRIVDAHDWSFDVKPTTKGMKLVVEDVTTLDQDDGKE